jgi:glycosyltransferase involved in cell wall biosynthesis
VGLGLVIPVRDDHAALNQLLIEAGNLDVFDQIVVVDDGSAEPVTSDLAHVIRQDSATGPGHARNCGLAEIETDHVLFFDSDDIITPEIIPLWHDLAARDFDFCLFRHADSRQIAQGRWHQMPNDDALWRLAGMGGQHLRALPQDAVLWLAQTANYPWNKIYRSDFLRDAEISFPNLKVHNDIAVHWKSFSAATRILASDRICATHTVSIGGGRLTNFRGRERLDAIASLQDVSTHLPASLRLPFQTFTSGLFDWIYYQIDPQWREALLTSIRQFWQAVLGPQEEAQLIHQDPVLALRIGLQMAGGRTPC